MNTNRKNHPALPALGLALVMLAALPAWGQPATVVQKPISQTVCEGSDLRLECTAAGQLPINYLWRCKKGFYTTWQTNISLMSTNCALVLSNVQASMAGYYTVEVSNAAGSQTSGGAYIMVLKPNREINGFSLLIVGQTSVWFRVEYCDTTPPTNWTHLSKFQLNQMSGYRFTDPMGTNMNRFYRIIPPAN